MRAKEDVASDIHAHLNSFPRIGASDEKKEAWWIAAQGLHIEAVAVGLIPEHGFEDDD